MGCSSYPTSARQLEQLVDPGAYFVFGNRTRPRVGDSHVVSYENRHRLIGNTVLREDVFILVEPPPNVPRRQHLQSAGLCSLEVGLPGRGDEVDPVAIVCCYGIDDGQLPPTGRSPFGPEDEVDRVFCAGEGELASSSQFESEIGRQRQI